MKELFKRRKSEVTVEVVSNLNNEDTNLINNFDSIGIAIVSENDLIETHNSEFLAIVNSPKSLVGTSWDEFFCSNFKKESHMKSVPGIYKFKNDIHSDYIIHTNYNANTRKRYCWIHKLSTQGLNSIAKNRNRLLESKKLNALNIVEDMIYTKCGAWNNTNIELMDISNADDGYLFANMSQGGELLESYVTLIYSVLNLKDRSSSAKVKLDRSDGNFNLTTRIENFNYQTEDFTKRMNWEDNFLSVSEILNLIKSIVDDLYVSITMKNRVENGVSTLFISLNVSDMDGVSWYQKDGKSIDQ